MENHPCHLSNFGVHSGAYRIQAREANLSPAHPSLDEMKLQSTSPSRAFDEAHPEVPMVMLKPSSEPEAESDTDLEVLSVIQEAQRSSLEHIAAMELELLVHEEYHASVQFSPWTSGSAECGPSDASSDTTASTTATITQQVLEAELRAMSKRAATVEARSSDTQQRLVLMEAERDAALRQAEALASSQLSAQNRLSDLEADLRSALRCLAVAEAQRDVALRRAETLEQHHSRRNRAEFDPDAEADAMLSDRAWRGAEEDEESFEGLSSWNGELLVLL
mmetsp:Transcript_44406/g.117828  ORF Transcript_44406/g.117828 Transcript_44406/m.117828 type:complete len:278 (-) Transcript_44406:710-1543(-)|eukprot:CAMPEP_0194532400 /NCGR_PEP_ID=MMETSP0253-20130528/69949_1 /TAXON_ID=2966 /ORGANISM="Noctiluca scintillans" /LENGTH=277 /DNA_ID=CAMNT_0039377847 /DNA_START=136 /DNA_END=969 /DNA_ORIENTATION=+